MKLTPPAIKSFPFGRRVAEWEPREEISAPVTVQISVAGSYNSALDKLLPFDPAATSTFPLGSSVAVWYRRSVFRAPVTVQVFVAGLYSSELEREPGPPTPPATSTLP